MKPGDNLYYIERGEIKWRHIDKVGRKYIHCRGRLKVGADDLIQITDYGSRTQFYHSSEAAKYEMKRYKASNDLYRKITRLAIDELSIDQRQRIKAILDEQVEA